MKYSLILFFCFFSLLSIGQQETYHRIKIFANDQQLNALQQKGVAIDHGNYKRGVWFESDFSESDIQIIKNNGINYEVVINDVKTYYLSRNENPEIQRSSTSRASDCNTVNTSEFGTPQNWKLGSMGGYFTYDEFIAHLDTMFSKYPNLITEKDTINTFTSHEGRPIYWLKISDNPTVDESEPEIMYTALHHAREAASLSQTIMYMYYLLENYGTDDEVTYLVDNTEMYFIPMVNPDGYVYNETTDPNGGGMWRKNRRDNGGSNMGVDLNRNYGYNWGYDDNGSSPNTNSDTYRGPSAFSEPETQATKWFVENHEIITCLNYHTYGNLLIYPWGYEASIYTPDSATFVEYAKVLTEVNNYNYGTGDQTVGYVTNGDSDDWMYGSQGLLSFTPEAGESGDGFWPAMNRIETISKENIRQNLNLAWLVNKYAVVTDLSGSIFNLHDIYIPVETKRLGHDNNGTYEVTLTPLDAYSSVTNSTLSYNALALLESKLDSFQVTLINSISEGQEFKFELAINNGTATFRDTFTKIFGTETNLFSSNGTSMNGFATTGQWGTTTNDYYSAPSSITDSPNGDYDNNTTSVLYLSNDINLSLATNASVKFMAKWAIENGYDYVQLRASNDGGSNWTPLCGKYTKLGTADQDQGQPLYDGYQVTWVEEEVSLGDFIGETIQLQFRLVTDVWSTADGFLFDDFEVNIIGDAATNIKPIESLADINIFPNPNNGSFTIDTKGQVFDLQLYDILGQEVLTSKTNKNYTTIQDLKKGSYLIKLSQDDTIITKQVIVY